jgi:putative transcriptional regulator
MAEHHPRSDLLLSYAAGALGESWCLAIATHLALCPHCRDVVSVAEELGGSLLEDIKPVPMASGSWENLESRLTGEEKPPTPLPAIPTESTPPTFPQPLRAYVGAEATDVAWKRLGGGAYQSLISTGDTARARLLLIPAGMPVPHHGHRGRELTLVLSGCFSDHLGEFVRGDLEDGDEELVHQPVARDADDCICLAVTDAPLRFTSLIPRLVQPFTGI